MRGVVQAHGGAVSAASDGPGRGAVFTVRLHLDHTVDERPAEAPRSECAPQPPRRVLVIDDNRDGAGSLRDVLEMIGHVVEVAHSGPEGLEKARAFHPEVVLCDIGLPGMDGHAVARALRADPELGGMRLVAMTGYAQPEDVDRALRSGFDVHMAKPPNVRDLEELLARRGEGPARPP